MHLAFLANQAITWLLVNQKVAANGLKSDPDKKVWGLGWGVVRTSPWHLVGIYVTKDVTETKAAELGVEYDAAYGSHRTGSDDFVTETRFL